MTERAEVTVGDEIPAWEMPDVDPHRMKTMAAILRDPYPLHWDRDAVASLGLGNRVVNQGPLNLGYLANMLMAWQGPRCIRRLAVSFSDPVLDHDHLRARGVVTSIELVDGQRLATCAIRLDRGTESVVTGTAVVALE